MPRHQIEHELAEGRIVHLRTRRLGKKPMLVPLFAAHHQGRSLGLAAQWWFDRL